ncbi:MAG: GNAT family N-acetyltransferase [Clostridiales bacterium]|nr:GNAT family N-acetyltransferase [Clostridiales bacterium]
MKYLIRLATKDDYDKIGGLYEKAFEHKEGMIKKYYKGFDEYLSFFVDENNAFVLEEDATVCGAVLVYETPDMFCGRSLYIEFLAVLPDCQNKGMGRALIEHVCSEARRRGITEVSIRTACYKEAYLIYRHIGFRDSQSDCRFLTMNLKK